jgi:hypothetical protein
VKASLIFLPREIEGSPGTQLGSVPVNTPSAGIRSHKKQLVPRPEVFARYVQSGGITVRADRGLTELHFQKI